MLFCNFCQSERKNENSLRNHERLCKKNPDRQYTVFSDDGFQKQYSVNQYIKAKMFGLPKPIVSKETRVKLSTAINNRSPEFKKRVGKKVSETINNKVKNGEWHTSLAKRMHYSYKGVDLHGKWELKYAMYLDGNNVLWRRCSERFEYIFEGKKRHYTPDFYLPETDAYIEIKGYKTEKDKVKWSCFPSNKKLIVLMKNDLKNIGIDVI